MFQFTVKKEGKLSKIILLESENFSYSLIMKSLRNKDIKVNGKRIHNDQTVFVGDQVEIYVKQTDLVVRQSYEIIFKDENVLVVNKLKGFSSEKVFEDLKGVEKQVYFIHRLDTNTNGIMIFALNKNAETELLLGFKNRTFTKKYLAVVKGIPPKSMTLESYLVKDSENALVKIYDNPVKGSVKIKTGFKMIESYKDTSLLEVELFTGKTHQIRAHLSYFGYPIVGDGKYGDNEFNRINHAKTQKLCAYKMTLTFEKGQNLYYLNGKTFEVKRNF